MVHVETFTQLQHAENPAYPLYAYEYGHDGFHDGATRIVDLPALTRYMNTVVRKAMQERREIRITDCGDLLCFHCANGFIKYDGVEPRSK